MSKFAEIGGSGRLGNALLQTNLRIAIGFIKELPRWPAGLPPDFIGLPWH
jgi:hypothetical protein